MLLTILLSTLLTGTVMGSQAVNYSTGRPSETVNTAAMAFDGNMNTFFASYDRSYTWCGLDLGEPCVIDRVGWSPRNDGSGPKRVQLGVFEGANSPDFLDAVPLYIIPGTGVIGQMHYADVTVTKAFRYVRYVGPADARCNVAEVEFYGEKGAGAANPQYYRPGRLPVVLIHTIGAQNPYDKEHEIRGLVTIVGTDDKVLVDSAGTRLRGNASMDFPKKPYRIKFDSKQQPLDAPAKAKKWTLINNYGDKSLMRNLLAFELSRRLGLEYTPYGRAVDLFLNGEYKGVYQLCDQIEVGKGRVDIDKMDETCTEGENLTGGYLLEVDAYANQEPAGGYFYSSKNNPVTIKYPDVDDILTVQYNYIKGVYNTMEQKPADRMNMPSFVRHFLVGEIAGNTDTYWSMYVYKRRSNDTLFVGPTWDHDLSFENDARTYPINNLTDWIYASKGSCAGNMRSFVNSLVKSNSRVKQLLGEEYARARDRGMCAEWLCAIADELAYDIDPSQQLNFVRWPILKQRVHQNPRVPSSYMDEIEFVKKYIVKRFDWMDKKLYYVPSDPSGMEEHREVAEPAVKCVRNGQMLIVRDGETYTLQGVKL